ncbi:MAG: ribosome maturation factor RimP [Calditerrivibrio sp.]|nr:ribosome maturation factor RimP [Calditerrivibrio sp.]
MREKNSHIVERVKEYAKKLAEENSVEIFDVQFVREPSGYVLRIYLDKEHLTLEDCAIFSKEISKWLDTEDFIEHKYNLEVSSPGLNRPIRGIEDFKKYVGKKCKIELFKKDENGRKSYTGYIKSVAGDVIQLEYKSDIFTVCYNDIKKAHLEYEF